MSPFLDLVSIAGAGASAACGLGVLFIRFAITPTFMEMFKDFGGTLPRLTRLAVSYAGPFGVAAFLVTLGLVAALPLLSLRIRRTTGIAGTLLGIVALAGSVVALYLPIFTLAATIE